MGEFVSAVRVLHLIAIQHSYTEATFLELRSLRRHKNLGHRV
jgi:hypothetical protein